MSADAGTPLKTSGRIKKPLPYTLARETLLEDGDIVLFSGRKWSSRIVRFVTRSKYSHAGIVANWDNRMMVMEAQGYGVRAACLSEIVLRYDGGAELWKTKPGVDLTAAMRLMIVQKARMQLGKDYSHRKALGYWKRVFSLFLSWRVVKRFRRTPFDRVEDANDWYCSEYVSWSWACAGVALTEFTPEFTTPDDLAKSKLLHCVGTLVFDRLSAPHDNRTPQPASLRPESA
jgi:hypothetical protein